MPSPVGHALGGLAVGWLGRAVRAGSTGRSWPAAIFAGLGVVPDVDVLRQGTHRLYTHSIAAVALVALLRPSAFGRWAPRRRRGARGALVVAAAAAYGSHLLLDWLGDDRSVADRHHARSGRSPTPTTSRDLRWFPPVERRYWLPGFWTANLRAIALGAAACSSPLVALAGVRSARDRDGARAR